MTVNFDNEKIQTFNADFLDMLMEFDDWTPGTTPFFKPSGIQI